jgi:hypothetical protein
MDKIATSFAALLEFFKSSRLGALTDVSAWLLIAPALAALYAIDPALAKTFAQWSIFGLVLAGAAVMISRVIFPQIDLQALIKSVIEDKSTAAGIVAASIVFFVGLVMLAMVIWAKA